MRSSGRSMLSSRVCMEPMTMRLASRTEPTSIGRNRCGKADTGAASMIVARNALGLGDPLVFHRGLEHHALRELVDQPALDLLPGRLVSRELVAAVALQRGAALVVFLLGDEDVGGALVEI